MSAQLKGGDVVTLKSDGPAMTIEYVDGKVAHCTWFVGCELRQAKIWLAALEIVK